MRARLLIVDDLAVNRRLLRAVLESEGFEVVDAVDGVEALAVLAAHDVVAIISDILMPNMDGYRLCQEVRKDDRFAELPFLFYTSTYISAEDERLAAECGGDGFLRKPAPPAEILAMLSQTRERRRNRPIGLGDENEMAVMHRYNAVLVRKLEDKNAELTVARDRLTRMNEELERRVEQRTAELRQANEELDAFSQSIAHDMRNPLMAIDLLASLLEDEMHALSGGNSLEHVIEIRHTTQRMHRLVEDLLALARATRGTLQREPACLTTLARDVSEKCAARWPQHRPRVSIADGLDVNADPGLVRIVLENLLENAWKYTSQKKDARIEVGHLVVNGEEIFFIGDNGAGFEAQHAGRLFQPFVRLHSAEEFPGTGIGLTTVRRVVERHGGRVWAKAAPEAGATFYFTLAPTAGHLIG